MTLKTAPGTQALLDLENRRPEVLFERIEGSPVPLWPQVRNAFSVELNKIDYPLVSIDAPEWSRANAWVNLARAFLPSRWDASRARKLSSVVFLVGGGTIQQLAGRQRNWLIEDFVERADGASVVQWRPLPAPGGPPSFSETWSLDRVTTRSAAFARLSRRDPEPQVRRIMFEIARLLDADLSHERLDALAASAVYAERQRPHLESAVGRILDRFSPSVVLMEDASYGAYGSIIKMMKGRGIHVAEPQHGWIGPTHAAYNFGEAMRQPELASTLPDELLTFGDYWAEGLRFPAPITVVGKPHLEANVARARPVHERSRTLLVVSSTADPDEMSDFVLRVRGALDGTWGVAFRPHPSERAGFEARYPRLADVPGVRVDSHADVYESLADVQAVVGVASTVLFEARAFGCRVFVRASPLLEHYVGDRFGDPLDGDEGIRRLAAELRSEGFAESPAQPATEAVWAPGALSRFDRWLAERLKTR